MHNFRYDLEKDIAKHIAKTFGELHGGAWHCIVGTCFGSFVTHESGGFTYFCLGQMNILLFKNGEGKHKDVKD